MVMVARAERLHLATRGAGDILTCTVVRSNDKSEILPSFGKTYFYKADTLVVDQIRVRCSGLVTEEVE